MNKNIADGRLKARGGSGRVVVYDWLRLIAIIFVVVGHSSYLGIHTQLGGVNYVLPPNVSSTYYEIFPTFFRELTGWVYGFHMPLFFVLSGAVLALRPIPSFDTFVVKKIRRLIIPFFIYGALFMLPVKVLGNFYEPKALLPAITGLLTGTEGGHLWFLPALFWCMVVFVAMEKLLKRKTQSVFLLLLLSGLIQCTYSTYIKFDFFYLAQGIGYIFWFALGYTFEHYRPRFEALGMKKILLIFAALAALEIFNYNVKVFNKFFTILSGTAFSFVLAYICSRIFKCEGKKWWNVLTRDLFYVYIFHDPLEYVVLRIFFGQGLLASSWGCFMYILCRFVLVFAVSLALGELIRKLKKVVLGSKWLTPRKEEKEKKKANGTT